jgi:hypothetical protein
MAIYELTKDGIRQIEESKFAELGFSERGDLQRLLRQQVDVISPDTLVIAEEFGDWQDSPLVFRIKDGNYTYTKGTGGGKANEHVIQFP